VLRDYLTAGGMADLYLAESPRFPSQALVVKTIQPRFLEHTKVVQMFVDEGRIAQALDHPNIVKIVDVGQADGQYFIAMEYIQGKDLVTICRRGVEVRNFLPRSVAVRIILMALRGLIHAHEKRAPDGEPLRIVHCDISPGNIVVSWGGTAKIVDFGIARATIQLRAEDESVAGKYNYMAPEQVRGEDVDARADLFSLGVILYEITVGHRLFRGRPEQVIRLVLDEDIRPPSLTDGDFPEELERIIMRALERDLTQRYQSARELYSDLSRWLASATAAEDNPKREIAEYLNAIFNENAEKSATKLAESDEFGGESMVTGAEELALNRGVPRTSSGLHELPVAVDPPDAPDNLFAPTVVGVATSAPKLLDPGPSPFSAAYNEAVPDEKPAPTPTPAVAPLTPLVPTSHRFRDDETGPSKLPLVVAPVLSPGPDVDTKPIPKVPPTAAKPGDGDPTPVPPETVHRGPQNPPQSSPPRSQKSPRGPIVVSSFLVAVAVVGAALYFLLRG